MLLAANAFTLARVEQLTANGIINGAAYGLLGVGFAIILGVSGRFHYAYGIIYTFAAYMIYTFHERSGLGIWEAVALGVIVATILGVAVERVVYRPLAAHAGASALLAIFVASLGLGIAGENLIRLFYSSAAQNLTGMNRTRIIWGDAIFLNLDLYHVLTAVALVVAFAALLRYTPLGRAIKATRSNPDMARIIGITPTTIYLVCFAVGTALASEEAFWYGLKFTVTPDMGFTPVIFAFVVAFLAGTQRSPIVVFVTGIGVALVEQYSSIWLSVRWTQTAVFVILLIYLVYRSVDIPKIRARLRVSRIPVGG